MVQMYHGTFYTMVYHGTSVPCGVTIPKKPYGIPVVNFVVLPWALPWYTIVKPPSVYHMVFWVW